MINPAARRAGSAIGPVRRSAASSSTPCGARHPDRAAEHGVQNFSGFASAMQGRLHRLRGHVASDGTVTLSGAGTAAPWRLSAITVHHLPSSLPARSWIMGSDRGPDVSCYDGAGPAASLGVHLAPKFGTPVR